MPSSSRASSEGRVPGHGNFGSRGSSSEATNWSVEGKVEVSSRSHLVPGCKFTPSQRRVSQISLSGISEFVDLPHVWENHLPRVVRPVHVRQDYGSGYIHEVEGVPEEGERDFEIVPPSNKEMFI